MSNQLRSTCTRASVFLVCVAFHATATPLVRGQDAATAQDTALIVEGRVEQVFQGDGLSLVKVLVQKSEVPSLDLNSQARYPAPGERVYIHVPTSGSIIGRVTGRSRTMEVPPPNSRIRAFLSAGRDGEWQAEGKGWYQETTGDQDPAVVDGRRGERTGAQLGLLCQRTTVDRKTALKVIQVTPGSPAAAAGIEPGDILVEANRVPLQSQSQLEQSYRDARGQFALTVRDVRSGRDVLVNVEAAPEMSKPANEPLGITSELAFYSGEPALKVTAVTPNSPAQRAGIKEGILILKANGAAVSKPEALESTAKSSQGRLELQIVDPKDRREQTVRVSL